MITFAKLQAKLIGMSKHRARKKKSQLLKANKKNPRKEGKEESTGGIDTAGEGSENKQTDERPEWIEDWYE